MLAPPLRPRLLELHLPRRPRTPRRHRRRRASVLLQPVVVHRGEPLPDRFQVYIVPGELVHAPRRDLTGCGRTTEVQKARLEGTPHRPEAQTDAARIASEERMRNAEIQA